MGNRGPLHSSCYPGKRVIIKLRDGTHISGKFQSKHSRFIVVDGKKIQRDKIEMFAVEKYALSHGLLKAEA